MRPIAILMAVMFALPSVLTAQGLAAIARQEEERRKSIKAAGKVYTNENLKADITASPDPSSNASPATPAATQVPSVNLPAGDAETPPGEKKDEAYWRGRISAARSALERSRIFADALQSRLNALSTDIVNRDDPAQRAQLELERQRALAELERVKTEMAEQTKAITEIEEEARKAGVPPGWLR